MLSYIALLPGVLAFIVAVKISPQQAFLRVYLPCLLLLPDYLRAITPGLPDPTFSQSASVGLFIASVLRGFPGYTFSALDLVIFAYAFCVGYSEYLASGYSDAQNLIFAMLFSVAMPYVYAKSYIEPFGQRFDFARRIVLMLVLVAFISIYESRFGVNPWSALFGTFFPGQSNWVVTFRFGLARSAGPFGHALIAGIVFAVGYRLQRWLEWSEAWPKGWPPRLSFMAFLPMKPARFLTLVLLGGFFLTLAKGSWTAAIIASLIIVVGRARNRVLGVGVVAACIVFVLIPAVFVFLSWASVGRENAKSDNQETAAYRYELVVEYLDIAKQHAHWGWGLTKWPQVPGMSSIDNYYLLVFLMHGQWALGLLVFILIGMPIRLVAYGMRAPPPLLRGASLPFTLAAMYLIYIVNLGTVYMGLQSAPLLMMITGWAEAYMRTKGREAPIAGQQAHHRAEAAAVFSYRRVL